MKKTTAWSIECSLDCGLMVTQSLNEITGLGYNTINDYDYHFYLELIRPVLKTFSENKHLFYDEIRKDYKRFDSAKTKLKKQHINLLCSEISSVLNTAIAAVLVSGCI